MSAILQPDDPHFASQLAPLPVFAQSLVACRVARRAVQAMLTDLERNVALSACDALEDFTKQGGASCAGQPNLGALASISAGREQRAAFEALHFACCAVTAAQRRIAAPVDSNAIYFVGRCIAAVNSDPRISKMQVAIILKGDIDQLSFICHEAKIGTFDGVSDYVLARITPCHAFSLIEPPQSIEEKYR